MLIFLTLIIHRPCQFLAGKHCLTFESGKREVLIKEQGVSHVKVGHEHRQRLARTDIADKNHRFIEICYAAVLGDGVQHEMGQ